MSVQTAGRFTLLRKLPAGGMGRVFEAEDPESGRRVALKLIDLGADADSQEILRAERRGAELQKQLCALDTRVAQIYEFGEMPGYFYISMEYIEGEDISELIRGKGLPPEFAMRIAQDVLDVLDHAHHLAATIDGRATSGIVHGDVKPRNIRVTPDGGIKVLDFGIAKALSATRNFTQNVFASVQYSSPERLRTGEVDVSSDLWGVAVVLYEILEGHPYFEAENGSKLEHMIRDYHQLRPIPTSWPEPLRGVVARALSPYPEIRFSTAREFAHAIEEIRTESKPIDEKTVRIQSAADPEATRRVSQQTVRTQADLATGSTATAESDATRKTTATAPPRSTSTASSGFRPIVAPAKPSKRSWFKDLFRVIALVVLVLFLVPVFYAVNEYMVWRSADQLASDLKSEKQKDLDAAWRRYSQLASRSHVGISLWSARDALSNRLMNDVDHVIARYEEPDPPLVPESDWMRAQAEASHALQLEPNDKDIHGKLRLIDGHLARIRGTARHDSRLLEESRQDFEDAAKYMKKSPDPWLGLARLDIYSFHDLEHGEAAIKEADRRGHEIGKRETAELADGYRYQGERAVDLGNSARDSSDAQRYYEIADQNLNHARELYQSILPWAGAAASLQRVNKLQARLTSRR
ncbi:serine/threonine-protein kinase [Occallatibacter savannae]|uniref:serine/threonine-protein kinase n=1 Tax=Occallatibacter savannae TaxID=1002691 RepID=UPI000D69A2F8|nr:serine/threonine-protein kinase [Occallatibacter savannae]